MPHTREWWSVEAAVISYNLVAPGQDGWKATGDNRVLLVQGRSAFATLQEASSIDALRRDGARLIDALWPQLVDALTELDFIVVYVGSYGSERAIQLLSEHHVPPAKVTFVSCLCNGPRKREAIERLGYSDSLMVPCTCGGQSEMERIYTALLDTGKLPI